MTGQEQVALIEYVRDVARSTLTAAPCPCAPASLSDVAYGGVFVTLRGTDGRLRGCMGRLSADGPFDAALADVTGSSLNDPRFVHNPVTADELESLGIEVSILGPLWVAAHPADLTPGVHGVFISREGHRGCFLPQVASEHGWTMERFLSECCRLKAGLPEDAWRDPQTLVQAFEITKISDRSNA